MMEVKKEVRVEALSEVRVGVEVPVEVHVGVVHVRMETRAQTIYPIQPEYKFQEKMVMMQCYYPVEALAEVPVEAFV
jgi:hypothetical protein